MNPRPILMFGDDDEETIVADAIAQDKAEETESVCDADKIEELIRRSDDIDQLTADYIIALMGMSEYGFDLSEIGVDTQTLNAIENEFEGVLESFGIQIYRPTMVKDANGQMTIVGSIYDEY